MEKEFESKLHLQNHPDSNSVLKSKSFVFRAPQEQFKIQEFQLGKIYGVDSYSKKDRLSENEARFYAAEVIDALEYMHGVGLIHRDIKNLLLTAEWHIKIADFGSVMPMEDSQISVLPSVPSKCEGIQRTLRSAEVYDPNKNRWSFVADMSTAMVPFIGVVFNGRWFLKGLGAQRQVMSEAYTPETNSWSVVNDGMVGAWRNPSMSLNGQLYALDCRDGCKLRIYDEATDSCNKFIDSKIHLGSSRAVEAATLVPLNGKVCIIRNNMSISLVDVSSPDRHVESNPQLWEDISGKLHFKNIFSNLWFSIVGRSGLKSHILHCQVLQA